jgi:hypothetical protein
MAREGFGWHYTLSLPIAGICLSPKLQTNQHVERESLEMW